MTSRDFCYWLQGFIEISHVGGDVRLSADQLACVKAHLNLVFKHEIDPSFGDEKKQAELNKIHGIGGSVPGRPDLLMRC
jgi:hypothetical protein